jgi:D-sedoheptulose 7-phosphate isomerase
VTECVSASLSSAIAEAYKHGNKVLICGNGGLAAESEHFAAELMGKYGQDIFITCFALTSNSSLITALANDIGFENVFSHQVETIGKEDDVFIGMTTSASKNIIKALAVARDRSMYGYLINKETVGGDTVGEIQNNIIKFLHEVALEAKEKAVP